jgi:hypothetical protein
MVITPRAPLTATSRNAMARVAGAGAALRSFGEALRTASPGASTAAPAPPGMSLRSPATAPCAATGPARATFTAVTTRVVTQVAQAQRRMDRVLDLARSGRDLAPAQLLSLQAQVYRASQELDLAGKVVEKAIGGIKQVLQTQV